MDASAQRELYSIKVELNNIIREMEDISTGIRNGFIGIGNEKVRFMKKSGFDKGGINI